MKIYKITEARKQIGLEIELVSNNDDCAGIYSRCPCQECCNASMRTLDKLLIKE